jgi:hypothetical protein
MPKRATGDAIVAPPRSSNPITPYPNGTDSFQCPFQAMNCLATII